jgi:hypothetical protein
VLCCSSGLDAVWDGVALPGKWTAMKSRLVHLGPAGPAGGKFCPAIMYDRIDDEVFAQGTVPQIEEYYSFYGAPPHSSAATGLRWYAREH